MINIGCYVLDQEEMTLNRDGNSVKLEPKVLAVLTYFYQNGNRYIPMAELHEKVWQDRCVSDAAVRRVIGKLRLLFNDDHKAPNYIQSLPKRGYKLICKTSYAEDHSIAESVVEVTVPTAALATSTPLPTNKPTPDDNTAVNNTAIGWLTKTFSWGNKTVITLFIAILALLFIGPLVYRITALIS